MNEKILLIDDEPEILQLISEILITEGFYIKAVNSGKEGITSLKTEPFDLVVTDMKMPQMDGLQLLREIKKIDNDIEVIILTGYANDQDVLDALTNGEASFYLTKPLQNIEDIVFCVKQFLDKRRLKVENKNIVKQISDLRDYLKKALKDKQDIPKHIEKILNP
ncbi:MAG: response regulator [Desulfobacterales bacterium]|nr:response regulator [Desulfobacterales bacterium]MBF0398257.1 response regulator [Desulfobacterales bacterium]